MLPVCLNLLALGISTFVSENLWRTNRITAESSRKFMHFFGGILAALWPLYLTWGQIRLLVFIAVAAILVLRVTGLAKSFFAVKRQTYGDIIGPATIGVLALIGPPDVLFIMAVLHMTVADGLAALVGVRFGAGNSYTVMNYQKSIAGTLACLFSSYVIMLAIFTFGDFSGTASSVSVLVIPVAVALVENVSVFGMDNALIALTVSGLGKLFNFY